MCQADFRNIGFRPSDSPCSMVACAATPAPPYAWLCNPSWIAPGNARKKLHSASRCMTERCVSWPDRIDSNPPAPRLELRQENHHCSTPVRRIPILRCTNASMASLPEIQCPTCRKHFPADIQAPTMPFCSMRCKMVDLNQWFTEEIGLPAHTCDDPEQEDEPQPPSSPKEWRFD